MIIVVSRVLLLQLIAMHTAGPAEETVWQTACIEADKDSLHRAAELRKTLQLYARAALGLHLQPALITPITSRAASAGISNGTGILTLLCN